jgi:hypothetical protein
MTKQEELDKARRRYRTAVEKVSKTGYLSGNGAEQELANAYEQVARLQNAMSDQPFLMLPKRRFRK